MRIEKPVTVLGAALFISLALNLFMAGVMLGRSYDRHPGHEWAEKDRRVREKLSEADRNILRESMAANREKFKLLQKDLGAARARVQEAVRAGDGEALKDALAAETDKKSELLRLMQESRAAAMLKLSPEGQAVLGSGRGRFGGWHGHGDSWLPEDPGGPDDPGF